MKRKLNLQRTLMWLLIINPVLSLLLDNTNVYYHYVLFPLIMMIVLLIERKQRSLFMFSLTCCVLTAISVLFALAYGSQIGKVHNHLFSYVDAILLMMYSTRRENIFRVQDWIEKHIKTIRMIVIGINIVELFLIITHRGYVYIYSWRGEFYQGTNSMPHTLAYLMLVTIVYVLLLVIFTRKKAYSVFALIPAYGVFASGARVSLLLAGALIAILLSVVLTEKQKNVVIKVLKILPVVVIFLVIFKDKIFSSDLMTKIMFRSTSGNTTAGRTYIWSNLLYKYIHDSNLVQYIFGQGDDKSYLYNSLSSIVGVEVWAHNDFVQIIIGKGFVGIALYLYALFKYIKTLFQRSGNIYSWAIMGFVLAAAFLNGFYSYRDVNLCIPLLMLINEKLTYRKKIGMENARSKIFNYSTSL